MPRGLLTAVLLTASALLPQGDAPHPVTIALFVVGYVVVVLGGAARAAIVTSRAARAAPAGPGRVTTRPR